MKTHSAVGPRWMLLAALAWSGTSTSPAFAQQDGGAAECMRIADDVARLACYDRAFGRARPSQPDGESAAAPAPVAPAVPAASAAAAAAAAESAPPSARSAEELEASFGAEDLEAYGAGSDDDLDSLQARVTEVVRDRRGRHLLRLDNGQAWRQVEATQFLPAKVDDTVKIWRGTFDAYRLRRTDGGQTVTVRRVE